MKIRIYQLQTLASLLLQTLASLLLGACGVLVSAQALSSSGDDARDSDVPVHFVSLKGHGGDNALLRKELLESHRACFELLPALGKKPVPLPPTGIPAHVLSKQIDIYYAANRTLSVSQGVLYSIDMNTCALTETPHHITAIFSSAGKCDIDHVRKEARGMCDMSAHRKAKIHAPAHAFPASPPPKLDHLSAEQRKLVEEQMKKMSNILPSTSGSIGLMRATAEVRQIAGMHCTVWQAATDPDWKLCIASLASHATKSLQPAPPVISAFNSGVPGLLLEAKTAPLTLKAEQASLNQTIPESRFNIPAGFKMRTIVPGEMQ